MNKLKLSKLQQTIMCFFFLALIGIFSFINLAELFFPKEEKNILVNLSSLESCEDTAVTLWGGFQKLIGKKRVIGNSFYSDVVRMKNKTTTMADENPDFETAIISAIYANEFANNMDSDFLYVLVPGKELSKEDFPKGITDYSVEKYNGIRDSLLELEIPFLDMRRIIQDDMKETGNEWMNYFYQTDHHWRNNAAFLAYQNICARLCADFGMNDEYLNPQSYNRRTYENVFLGSCGRMVGPLYGGLDDYELWVPNFETDFILSVPFSNIEKKGSFEDCFVNYENLEEYSYDYYAYYAYLKEDYELIEIKNNKQKDGPKVIILRDSEAVPVSVFLATQCSELDIIDLRYQKELNPYDYITDKKPDLILYIYGTGYVGSADAFLF